MPICTQRCAFSPPPSPLILNSGIAVRRKRMVLSTSVDVIFRCSRKGFMKLSNSIHLIFSSASIDVIKNTVLCANYLYERICTRLCSWLCNAVNKERAMQDSNPRLRLRRPEGYPDYPNCPEPPKSRPFLNHTLALLKCFHDLG